MFFYLEWINKRPDKITLTDEKPDNINFQSSFKIKKKEYIICGNINPEFREYLKPIKLPYRKPQYLLSHLQKCIRRMEDVKSVQTAKHIIDLDCNMFLRRLPIIMIEDVTLHSCFPILVWLMIAYSKKFTMKNEIIKWLLGVVYLLSVCKEKTYYEKIKDEIDISNKKDDIMINTLRFRKAYGGMYGDMEMIEYYTLLIMNDKIQINNEKIPLVKISMESLQKKEWIYQANDFHCNRSIIPQVKKYFPKMEYEYIKELIWNFSSSQNNRIIVEYDKKQFDDWEKIKKVVKYIQKTCIYY
tara:strand:+ start:2229 stop:3125 length:897 start_codon:yes stop_codon:yes gene_type:complete